MKKSSLTIVSLLKEKEFLELKLQNLLYGSIEIRERVNKKYIFVHFRENERLVTKYAGEYSDYLYRLISENSVQAKQIKSELRKINKALTELGYTDQPYSADSSKYVDYVRKNLSRVIQSILYADKTPLEVADIESVLNGQIKGLSSKDVMKIVNLRNSLELVTNKYVLSALPDYNMLLSINKLIEEGFIFTAGSLRVTPYTTNGRYEAPGIPIESIVRREIERFIKEYSRPEDQAVESLLYIMKSKLFLFGNKRTALTYVNFILITQGAGLMLIPTDLADEFKQLYIEYRDHGDDAIKGFLKDRCIIKL